jgi:hypothetical protein
MKVITFIFLIAVSGFSAWSQTDSLDFGNEPEKKIIRSAFDGSTIINSQSTNVNDAGQLSVIIAHRFGTVKEGFYNFYGIDEAAMRLGFEYGVTNKVTLGIGRSTAGKNYDGYLKYRLITQTKGAASGNIPITVTLFVSSAFSSQKLRVLNQNNDRNYFIDNLVHTYQTIVSRQLSSRFSLQVSPTVIHKNLVETASQPHNIYALGSGLRMKVRGKLSINVDYSYVWKEDLSAGVKLYNPIGIGMEVVTGGHVFKLHFTNSVGMIEKEYLTNTTDNFFKGQMRFGFTLLRSFIIKPTVKGGSIY